MKINFVLGKNEGHMPNNLGGRLIVVVKQADRETNFHFFKIQQLQF